MQAHRLARLEVAFKLETTYPDAVSGEAEQTIEPDGLTFAHRITRESDGKEVATARTRWAPVQDEAPAHP